MIDPHIAALMQVMADGGFRLPEPLEAASLRAMLDAPIPAPPVAIAERRDIEIVGEGRIVPARLYHPKPGEILPIVLFFHGGGWVHGTLDTHDRLAARLAVAAECAVLSVDYRLAPEHPFPAAIEDAMLALQWVRQHHGAIGGDAGRIGLAGDSAGGNLTAVLINALRKRKEDGPACAWLASPWTDLTMSGASLTTKDALDPIIHKGYLDELADAFVPAAIARNDPRISPLFSDLHGFPPTLVQAGSHETLLDDATRFAAALGAADVDVTLEIWPEMIHAWPLWNAHLEPGRRALERAGTFIRRHI